MKALKPYFLLQSFRFGAEIAYVGATILHVGKNVKKILVGGKQNGKTAVFHHLNLEINGTFYRNIFFDVFGMNVWFLPFRRRRVQ